MICVFILQLRTSIQCAAFCLVDDDCNAFLWEEAKPLCTLLGKDGLCLDKDSKSPLMVFVDQANLLPNCSSKYCVLVKYVCHYIIRLIR